MDDKLRQLKIEDFVWYVYFGIIVLCLISNKFEKDYILTNNPESKKIYREMLIIIFSIALIIYIYFVYDGINDIKKLRPDDTDRKKFLNYYSLAGSILILISGFIFLSIAIIDTDLDVELAFN